MRPLLLLLFLLISMTGVQAQPVRQLIGQRYTDLNRIEGFEHYIPIKGYYVFDEMICFRYQDTVTFKELMVFQQDVQERGRTVHIVADALKLDRTGRRRIIIVGNNRFAPFSQKNIIIALEDIDTTGRYAAPMHSRKIHYAYTLQHKGHVFEAVPLTGLYRIGGDYFRDRNRYATTGAFQE